MNIIVTGAAGFIGFHLCRRLINQSINVIGIDNVNNYYDQDLKSSRIKKLLSESKNNKNFIIYKENIQNQKKIENIFNRYKPKIVIHLAAQAGVRYSIDNPSEYTKSNIVGFGNILENCKKYSVDHLLFASSSSVYGESNKLPFTEDQRVDYPLSIYAATKRSNELMAYSYSHLFNLNCTGLRFFTVYGPWGRPDMALFKFTKSILNGKKIEVYNMGKMKRDFTYIDDIVESIFRLIKKNHFCEEQENKLEKNNSLLLPPFTIFNIGNSDSVELLEFIRIIEKELNIKAIIDLKEKQLGDAISTYSDCTKLQEFISFKPKTKLNLGVKLFIDWYKSFYRI